MSRKTLKVMAGVAVISLLAAACSSSSSSSSSTTVKTSGAPIVVGQVLPLTGANLALPEAGTSMVASINALNASGGINGHPVVLKQCDSQGSASVELQCAQQLISDHVVATLGDNTFFNAAETQAAFSAAGIPRIGITEDATAEYGAKTNFDWTGGGVFSLVGIMDSLINRGYKKLTVIIPDSPSSAQTHLLLDPIAAAQGAKVVNYVLVSSASGDYSQYVAQGEQNGAQAMVIALGNSQLVQVAQAINQLNPNIAYATGIAGFSLNQLKDLGQFAKKTGFVWWTPGIDDVKNFPGIAPALAQLTRYEKGSTVNTMTSVSLGSWLTVHAFSEILKGQAGAVTAASVLADIRAAKDLPMNGIIKPWTPGDYQSAGSLSSIFTNVSNPWMYKITYNGSNTSSSPTDIFNTFAGLPGTSG
jgi:branched-chain amino acid transport system substrate-binding protein